MSHVTNDSQRNVNHEIRECMEHNISGEWVPSYQDENGDWEYEWEEKYTCGPSLDIDAAHGKCPQCGKVFTY